MRYCSSIQFVDHSFVMFAMLLGNAKVEGKHDKVTQCKGGKVLRRSHSDEEKLNAKDRDAKMSEADGEINEEVKGDTVLDVQPKKAAKDCHKPNKSTTIKTFSLVPVPSFHYQDLQRVRILQNEMISNRREQNKLEKSFSAQLLYQEAFKLSSVLQQQKAKAQEDYASLVMAHRKAVAELRIHGQSTERKARNHWEKRQLQLSSVSSTLGQEPALMRCVCNDTLQHLKDRICIRTAERLEGSGLGTHRLARVAERARADGKEPLRIAAVMLGHIIDSVERRCQDEAANSTVFVPPKTASAECVVANPITGETMAQVHAKELDKQNRKLEELTIKFKEAEQKRTAAWEASRKERVGGSTNRGGQVSGSRSKPRSRKSMGGTSGSHQGRDANVQGTASLSTNNKSGGQPNSMQMEASSRPMTGPMPVRAQPLVPRPVNTQLSGGSGGGSSRPVPGYIPSSYYQAGPMAPDTSSYFAGSQHCPTTANSSSASAAATMMGRPGVLTAASMMAAQVAAGGYGATNQVIQGHAPASTASNIQQMAQIAAMQTMAGQQSRRMQQPQMQHHQAVVQGVGGLRSGGGGAQFHPVIANVSTASSYEPPKDDLVHAFNQNLLYEQAPQQRHATKISSLSKYGYGDKYSATNVNARKNPDGSIVPASTPKLLPDGRFARPAGRQRKGMDWDAVNGWWVPQQQG